MSEIQKVIPLTFEIIKEIGFHNEDDWADLFGIDVFCYQNDDDLKDSNFIYAELSLDGEKYKMIHGFPGDNPHGLFFNYETQIEVGEGMYDSNHPAIQWYNRTTKNGCDFPDKFWYVDE